MLLRISKNPLLDLSATKLSNAWAAFPTVVSFPNTDVLVALLCSENTVFNVWVGSTILLFIVSVFTCSLKDSSSTSIGDSSQVKPFSLLPDTLPTLAFIVLIAESKIKISMLSSSNLLSKSWLPLSEGIGFHKVWSSS